MNSGLSSLKFGSYTQIGKQEQKKLAQIVNNLIDLPEATDFLHPVAWKCTSKLMRELQLDDYLDVIRYPMNLYKVQEKLKNRDYNTVEQVLDHLQLIWDNCKEYNKEGHYFELGERMEKVFRKMIKNYIPSVQYSIQPKSISIPSQQTSKRTNFKDIQQLSNRIQQKPPAKTIQQKIQPPVEESKSQKHDSEEEPEIQEVPLSEKNRFHQRLKQITQQQLSQIVHLIQEYSSEGFKHISGSRYQILVDNIDGETFKKLSDKLDDFIENQKLSSGLPNKKVKV